VGVGIPGKGVRSVQSIHYMRKAALLFNPLSGRRTGRRLADVNEALAVLKAAGINASATATRAAADAATQVKQAISEGCDTILACGGDGTIHDVLQGVVGTEAALGIIPLGTANSLAHDLHLPRSPAAAARAALSLQPRRIAAGHIEYQHSSGQRAGRYFTVTAGIGVDAHLFYQLNPGMKSRLGMSAYYFNATRLWLTHRMEEFEVEFKTDGACRNVSVSQLLAVRIRNFGGLLRELAPGASLERNDLRVVLFRTRSRLAYLQYITRGALARPGTIVGIETLHSEGMSCRCVSPGRRIFVEADGELLGTLPAAISVVPNAFKLLMPEIQG
jgi:diacylglycerol kinase (ATP)